MSSYLKIVDVEHAHVDGIGRAFNDVNMAQWKVKWLRVTVMGQPSIVVTLVY